MTAWILILFYCCTCAGEGIGVGSERRLIFGSQVVESGKFMAKSSREAILVRTVWVKDRA